MFKNYFDFSRKELSGILVLAVLILLLFVANFMLKHYQKEPQYDYSKLEKELAPYFAEIDSPAIIESNHNIKKETVIFVDSLFDPNTVDSLWFISKGFSPYLTRNILKYRSVLNGFKDKEDVRKVYGMTSLIYNQIEPYLLFTTIENSVENRDSNPTKMFKDSKKEKKNLDPIKSETITENKSSHKAVPTLMVDINIADTMALKTLPGIGSMFASRITKYRKIIGGYGSKAQLLEVYGFTPELLEKISPYILVGEPGITKINVNTLSVKALQSHPYIDFYQAKAIVDYRQKVKRIANFDQLFDIPKIDTTNFSKLRFYLIFE